MRYVYGYVYEYVYGMFMSMFMGMLMSMFMEINCMFMRLRPQGQQHIQGDLALALGFNGHQ